MKKRGIVAFRSWEETYCLDRGSRQRNTTLVQHGFRFEAMWLRASDYKETLKQAWSAGRACLSSLSSTWESLKGVAGSLRSWSKEAFGSIRKKIGKMERRLASIRASQASPASLSEEKHIESQLCELFEREEIMECQRSRVDWLKAGDRNTEFFQARASARRKTNRIRSVLREDGSTCNSQGQIKDLVQSFYEKLFTSEPRPTADEVLQAIPHKVTAEMNADLCKSYSDEEIKAALFQMGPTKAPGPDGFPALFYQHHWNFLGEDICQAVRGFLLGRPIPEGFCDSVIVLIPKTVRPKHLKNFRPISLCNVLYKIASKVLANRLKSLLPVVVSETQSAFVPGRLITDNALIAYECLHTIRKQRVKKPFFALKIDMMKAYDRVEWSYLHQCLTKLGLAPSWIDTVMRCVTNVRYAVRVNGELTQPVIPSRGIRQGDPISPYLFFLCTEGLSGLLFQKEACGKLHGIRNGRHGPSISHLLFADDSIFFAKSDPQSVASLEATLSSYYAGSGQAINKDKSAVFFGNHCPAEVKDRDIV